MALNCMSSMNSPTSSWETSSSMFPPGVRVRRKNTFLDFGEEVSPEFAPEPLKSFRHRRSLSEGSDPHSPSSASTAASTPTSDCSAIQGYAFGKCESSEQSSENDQTLEKHSSKQIEQTPGEDAEPEITTLMIRHIPCRFTQDEVMRHLNQIGFENKYDFFYLPLDARSQSNLGYAFVNFVDAPSAAACRDTLPGAPFAASRSCKVCETVPAHIQGLPSLAKHFKSTVVARSGQGPVFLSEDWAAAVYQPSRHQNPNYHQRSGGRRAPWKFNGGNSRKHRRNHGS